MYLMLWRMHYPLGECYYRCREIPPLIHYLQRVLDDSLNRANKVAKRGSIEEDLFLTKFKKDMLIQVAEEYRSEVHNLHASLSTQIPRSQELALVEACYDPNVLPNLSALCQV
jgi:hypothetical protein